MNFLALSLICLWSTTIFAQKSKLEERLQWLRDRYEFIRNNCTSDSKITTDFIDSDGSQEKDEQCSIACVLKEVSILNEEGFSRQVMDRIVSFLFEDEPLLKLLAWDINGNCEKRVSASKVQDECELALEIRNCLHQGWKRLAFKYWKQKWA